MTLALRIILVVVSLLTLVFVIRSVRNSKVKLEDAVFWFCFSGLLLVVSLVPFVFDWLAAAAGVYSTTNFVFLFFIFVLLIMCFRQSMRISQADTKIKELAQQLAIEKLERHSDKGKGK